MVTGILLGVAFGGLVVLLIYLAIASVVIYRTGMVRKVVSEHLP